MTITNIKELISATATWTLGEQHKYKRDYNRRFLVTSDTPFDSPINVMLDVSLPQLGQQYTVGNSFDYQSLCTEVTPTRDADKPYSWMVDVKYEILNHSSDKPPGQQNPNDNTDPRNWSPEISTSWVRFQKPMYVDVADTPNPIVNSCGDMFQPPLNVDDDRLQIRVSRFESFLDIATCLAYRNVINSDTWWNQAPGTLTMLPITGSKEIIDGYTYFKKTYTVELNLDGWGAKPVDRGLNRLASVNDDGTLTIPADSGASPDKIWRVPLTDPTGSVTAKSPQLLNGHGQPLPINGTPVWVAFGVGDPPPNGARLDDGYQVYKKKAFASLKDTQGHPLPDLDIGIHLL